MKNKIANKIKLLYFIAIQVVFQYFMDMALNISMVFMFILLIYLTMPLKPVVWLAAKPDLTHHLFFLNVLY